MDEGDILLTDIDWVPARDPHGDHHMCEIEGEHEKWKGWGLKIEPQDTPLPLNSRAQRGLRRGRATGRIEGVQRRGRPGGSKHLSLCVSVGLLVRAAERLLRGAQQRDGPGLGLRRGQGRAFSFWSCGGRIQIAGTMSKNQNLGQEESVD